MTKKGVSRRRFVVAITKTATLLAVASPIAAAELSPGTHTLELDRLRDGILYVPKNYQPGIATPLVVMFHGAGGSGQSCQYAFPSADEHNFLILAPDSRSELTWDLVLGAYGPDMEFLQVALRQTMARVTVDRQRLAIAGHSDGASYALSFGIGAGDVFGHLIALSPGVMTPVAANGKPKIFVAHGVKDTTMPIDVTSRTFVPRLRGLGYEVEYREYDGGHGAPPEIVRGAFEWLQRDFGRDRL